MSKTKEVELKKVVNDLLIDLYKNIDRIYEAPVIPQNEKFDVVLETKFIEMLEDTIRNHLWLDAVDDESNNHHNPTAL